jgi:hypothetical protein
MLRALAGIVQTSGVALGPVLQALRLSRALDHESVPAKHTFVQIHQSKTHGRIWTDFGQQIKGLLNVNVPDSYCAQNGLCLLPRHIRLNRIRAALAVWFMCLMFTKN